ERPQPARHFALRLQDDRRRRHPDRHHALQRTARQAAGEAQPVEARMIDSTTATPPAPVRKLMIQVGAENIGLLLALLGVIVLFSLLSPQFLSMDTFDSIAFQLPELGLLTLAMLMPIISGGINLSVTFTAN